MNLLAIIDYAELVETLCPPTSLMMETRHFQASITENMMEPPNFLGSLMKAMREPIKFGGFHHPHHDGTYLSLEFHHQGLDQSK